MLRLFHALFLSAVLVVTSITFAVVRGEQHDTGRDMVICTGTGLIVLSIGEDGEPVEELLVCPDAMSIFAAQFNAPKMPVQLLAGVLQLQRLPVLVGQGRQPLSPSARGPPLVV